MLFSLSTLALFTLSWGALLDLNSNNGTGLNLALGDTNVASIGQNTKGIVTVDTGNGVGVGVAGIPVAQVGGGPVAAPVSSDTVDSCGPQKVKCPVYPNSSSFCRAGACGAMCNGGYIYYENTQLCQLSNCLCPAK